MEKASLSSLLPRKRTVMFTLVVAISTFLALAVGRWAYYRFNHIVFGAATVKGMVTKIGARMDGKVETIEVLPSQHVTKGQVLARLTSQYLQAAVNRAAADWKRTKCAAEGERVSIDHDREVLGAQCDAAQSDLQAAESEWNSAKSLADRLEKDCHRARTLSNAHLIADSEMDRAQEQCTTAKSNADAAKSKRDAAAVRKHLADVALKGLEVREVQLKTLEAQVEVAKAAYEQAEADLADTVITAPEDGWIVDQIAGPGASVKVGDEIIEMMSSRGVWVQGWLDENALRRVRIGSKAFVSLDAYQGNQITGRVESIGVLSHEELLGVPVPARTDLDALLPKPALIPVRIALDDPDMPLQPGLTAVVGIEKNEPAHLVHTNAGSAFAAGLLGRETASH